jgi:hypothetical protein
MAFKQIFFKPAPTDTISFGVVTGTKPFLAYYIASDTIPLAI